MLLIGYFTVSSAMEDEKKSMSSKYSKQTMRTVEKLRRRFNLPKRTSVENVISYYRMYQRILDEPVYYSTPYRKL